MASATSLTSSGPVYTFRETLVNDISPVRHREDRRGRVIKKRDADLTLFSDSGMEQQPQFSLRLPHGGGITGPVQYQDPAWEHSHWSRSSVTK